MNNARGVIVTDRMRKEAVYQLVTIVLAVFVAVVSFAAGMKVAQLTTSQKGGEVESTR